MTFNEAKIKRDATGQFAEKTGDPAEITLAPETTGFTDKNGKPVPRPLLNPFRKGQRIVIPAGTVIRFRGEESLTARKQSVTVHMQTDGYYDEVRDKGGWGNFKLRPPTVTWPGPGGYWKDATVDQDVLAANNLEPEYNERQVELWEHQLQRQNFIG